ncbi:YfhO family protein [Vaginella massiliensis]|uniref:YfhO family protein n=1 Tax=Vaginella massiliensis TaxID=1816680 RepID=UPI000838008C|nr:YfhO family protein [Vaginella massiliensis]
MKNKNLIFSLVTLVFFALVAIFYCAPVFSGKAIVQPDIINYVGSSKEMLTYQEQLGENVYWSDAMFGGMPTYQTGAQYDVDIIKSIDRLIRFLPRPADYIFLLFAGFFILGLTLFRNWKYALTGSIFFALGAYYFIIIAAGHNAKVHAIAYFAPLVAGILLLYRRKYILGFLLTALFMGLELAANHIQMTYYLFLVMLVYVIVQAYDSFKKKDLAHFFKASGLVAVATVLALGLNAPRLLSTYEYSKETTRGKSDMTLLRSNESGLEKEYITQWSYGKLETLNLFIPNLYGGASSGGEDHLKHYIATLQNMQYTLGEDEFNQQAFQMLVSQSRSPYWGEQPGTSGPAYQGAVVVFLFVLGLFLVRGKWEKYKWWLLSATVLSIVLAWGKNFSLLTDFFIDYFPMYDKFRAVSSILVMAELTMPLLAILCLYVYFQEQNHSTETKKIVLYVSGTVVGFLILLFLFGGSIFSFTNEFDGMMKQQFIQLVQQYGPNNVGFWDNNLNELNKAIVQDRIELFKADTLRTLIFVLLTVVVLLAYHYQILKNKTIALFAIGLFALVDGLTVNKRYLNDDNFISKHYVDNPFPTEMSPRLESEANLNNQVMRLAYQVPINNTLKQISDKDKSHYRVYNETLGKFNEATTSYFVNSIGGYHAAKLGRYQDIIDVYLSDDPKMEAHGIKDRTGMVNVLNMLNTKYFIFGQVNEHEINQNPQALGNAWFTSDIKWAENANEEILAIQHIDPKKTTILNKNLQKENINFVADSTAQIKLTNYSPARLLYESNSKTPQLAVFSEVFYPHGWKAFVDGKEVNILKANYFLRALPLDAGTHKIEFVFEPEVIATGKIVAIVSLVLLLIAIGFGGFTLWKNHKDQPNTAAEVE